MLTRQEKALDYFSRGFHCSQSVLAAYADRCGLSEEQALKLGACFGSGMRRGEVCGACSGALMVLGSLYGQHNLSDSRSRQLANEVSATHTTTLNANGAVLSYIRKKHIYNVDVYLISVTCE